MYNETIIFYSKTPPNKGKLPSFDITFWEENRTCGDDVTVYIKIENETIQNWSFEGDTAIITTACASIFGESILGMKCEEIFAFGYNYIEELIGMPISERRKNASVLGLLTTRNALHQYLKDGKHDTFDDILKGSCPVDRMFNPYKLGLWRAKTSIEKNHEFESRKQEK